MHDDEDWQRLKNFMLVKLWVTDAQLDEMAPALGCAWVAIVIAAIIYVLVASRLK